MGHEGCLARPVRSPGRKLACLHGRRRPQRIYLQVRLRHRLVAGRRRRRPTAWRSATSISTPARSTSPGSTPTAPAPGCRWCSARCPTDRPANADLCLRRPGRRADQHPPRRRRGRRDPDGPAGMDRGQPGHRRNLSDADQQQRRRAPAHRHRRGQSALLQRPARAPRTSSAIRNGHIIRLRETGDTTEATDLHLGHLPVRRRLGPRRAQHQPVGPRRRPTTSPAPTACGSPGRRTRRAWSIRCCGSRPTTAPSPTSTNNQMLAALPGRVGDGGARTITNTGTGGATRHADDLVGAAPGATLKRFLVGPKECEITGVDSTPDGRTLFVNIQHPGENWATRPTSPRTGRRARRVRTAAAHAPRRWW